MTAPVSASELAKLFTDQFTEKLSSPGLADLFSSHLSTKLAGTTLDNSTLKLHVELLAYQYAIKLASEFPAKLVPNKNNAEVKTKDSTSRSSKVSNSTTNPQTPPAPKAEAVSTRTSSTMGINSKVSDGSMNDGVGGPVRSPSQASTSSAQPTYPNAAPTPGMSSSTNPVATNHSSATSQGPYDRPSSGIGSYQSGSDNSVKTANGSSSAPSVYDKAARADIRRSRRE
ncbi:hypothetical protein BDY21DRAFT_339110 [Lineolata rhizophorae]|uniref:Uncharacterized protein n=1 Tax=Lineolata rhizophorae TaxID=578093 RepID=A0A6A6P4X2_9PEZI|nr:hypothetical protein BDY21DRAFT_339110 [Lineolata rhizophorae]